MSMSVGPFSIAAQLVSTLSTLSARPAPRPAGPSAAGGATIAAAPAPGLGFKVVRGKDRGAYYRKVEAEPSKLYKGIAGTGYLPQVSFDPKRFYVGPNGMDDWMTGPLDRPSVYMGGNANGHEADVGLTWDRVYDSQGRPTYTDNAEGSDMRDPAHRFAVEKRGTTKVLVDGNGREVARGADVDKKLKELRPNFAFRPFWRAPEWNNPKPGSRENVYFYPGEKFNMSVTVLGKGQVRLDISGADAFNNKVSFSKPIPAPGFGEGGLESFKRVNSIDQFYVDSKGVRHAVERTNVRPTRTVAHSGGWESVSLLRRPPATGRVAMTGDKFTEVRGPDTYDRYHDIFHLWGFDKSKGGERVDIVPFSN